MNSPHRCESGGSNLELDGLLTADQRRTVSVADQEAFQRSICKPRDIDPIDAELDDGIQVDPYNGDPPSKRKDSELNRVLSILDSLERGNG